MSIRKVAVRKWKYYIIDFTGKPRAYAKYLRLRSICASAVSWMRNEGMEYEAAEIRDWMNMTGGFMRPHTPYYVTLTEAEFKLLVFAVRRRGTESRDYLWLRSYGAWS